jgi:hypothetical protein
MTEEEKQEILQSGSNNIMRANYTAFSQAMDAEMQQVYKDRLADQIRGNSIMQALNKAYQEKWNALPWYTKRYRRFKGWVYWKRRAVGEFIAGERFSN